MGKRVIRTIVVKNIHKIDEDEIINNLAFIASLLETITIYAINSKDFQNNIIIKRNRRKE